MSQEIDYKSSGVDIEAGDKLVHWIKGQEKSGPHKSIVGGLGGFSALFKLDLKKYKNPLLVSCTDGIGTKLKIALDAGNLQPVGIDLVAMCVNDLVTCGGDPLFFLDYYATGKLNLEQAQDFLAGVMAGLKQSNCALIGGETAEMPGLYQKNDFDAAGFCVGAVDEAEVIDGSSLEVGDVAIGISSSGFHSNGYSLVRKLFEKDMAQWQEQLLTPTRIYVDLVQKLKTQINIKAMAHITGGGLIGNIPRVMKPNMALRLSKWPWPDLFLEAQRRSNLGPEKMMETFNCGIGFVFFVGKKDAEAVKAQAKKEGWGAYNLGSLVKHEGEPKLLFEV